MDRGWYRDSPQNGTRGPGTSPYELVSATRVKAHSPSRASKAGDSAVETAQREDAQWAWQWLLRLADWSLHNMVKDSS